MDKIMNVLICFFDDDLAKLVNFSFHNDSLQDYDIIAICKSTLTLYLTLHEKWDFRQYAALQIVVELQVYGCTRQFTGKTEN